MPTTTLTIRFARLITDVLSPAVLVATLTLVVAWHSATSTAQALAGGLVAAAAGSIIPITYILRGVRQGRWTDHHVGVREQRKLPILICVLSTAAGAAVLATIGAPRQLIALVVAMVAALLIAWPVTLWARWKISIHALVAAGTTTALSVTFGPLALVTAPAAAAVCWSRVVLRDHTLGQVVAGGAAGTAAMALLFPCLL